MMEIWKDIKGYEGSYQISNLGRVKRLQGTVRNNIYGGMRIVTEKILSPTDNGHGYKLVGLRKDGRRKNHYVHRLVATAFIDNPHSFQYVNHLDRDRANNIAGNLEWCTQLDNVAYAAENMKKQKTECRATNTGEKYISLRMSRGGKEYYRVNIRFARADKSFKTIAEAIRYRNEVMQKWQSQ
jgi:hypothetical protein